jgi:signal transduction histidine kinase
MKIRLRLALVSIALIALSLSVCGTLLLNAAAKSGVSSAEENALAELSMLETSYQSVLRDASDATLSETAQRSLALYLFRQYLSAGSQFVLIRNGETLFNNSGYAVETLLGGAESATVDLEGKRLFLAASSFRGYQSEEYRVFIVRDVTGVYASITALTWQFIAICSGAFLVSAAVVMLCTFRALAPAQSPSAKRRPDRRRCVRQADRSARKDELAELAGSFNRMADAVQRQIEAVTATAEERKMLLGALTHELKTPMTSIIGYSESLQKTRLSKTQRARGRHLHQPRMQPPRTAHAEDDAADQLTGGEEIVLSAQPASALMESVLPTLRTTTEQCGAELSCSCEGACYPMDLDLMASVLINLVDNACDAGAKHISIVAAEDCLRVSDDGCGISPEIIARVTQPFFRANKARSRRQGHAGLGLALVSRIAQLHRAKLTIQSAENSGTTIAIWFRPSGNSVAFYGEALHLFYVFLRTCLHALRYADSDRPKGGWLIMKRILALGIAAAFLLTAGACKKSDDTAYEMPSDVERLYAATAQLETEDAALDYELPDGNYTWDTTNDNGCLTIHADADVIVPDTALSMVHVSNDGFTQAQVTAVFNDLFAGKTVTATIGENVQTRDEIQTQLDRMYRELEDGTYENTVLTKEEYENGIAQVRQAYEKRARKRATGGTVRKGRVRCTLFRRQYERLFRSWAQ